MRAVWFFVAAGAAAACSASAGIDDHKEPPSEVHVPDPPAPPADAGSDAPTTSFDAGPCSDCEWFPAECTTDVFCPNGPFDPSNPASLDSRTTITVIRGRSANDVWAAGAVGGLAHFDGTSWTRSDASTQETLRGLWLPAGAEVALGQVYQVFARGVDVPEGGTTSPGGWSAYSPSFDFFFEYPPDGMFTAAWSAPGSDWLWCAISGSGGGLWRIRRGTDDAFEGVTGIPSDRCSTAGCNWIANIHSITANELWAVGAHGAAVRIKDADSDSPTVKSFNTQTLNALRGVWEASATDAWAVGTGGTIRHYTGDPLLWDIVDNVPTTANLNAVWGFSSSDIWAVGDAGVALHYDGKSWSRVKIAGLGSDRPSFSAVWGAAAGHVWIGGEGVIVSLGGKP